MQHGAGQGAARCWHRPGTIPSSRSVAQILQLSWRHWDCSSPCRRHSRQRSRQIPPESEGQAGVNSSFLCCCTAEYWPTRLRGGPAMQYSAPDLLLV